MSASQSRRGVDNAHTPHEQVHQVSTGKKTKKTKKKTNKTGGYRVYPNNQPPHTNTHRTIAPRIRYPTLPLPRRGKSTKGQVTKQQLKW